MGVNAGHDLDLWNLREFLEHVDVDEVSIGQALISDALINGLGKTTREYLEICMVQ
jgi:pyridoxine 5-phosphate synthase